MCKVFFFFFSYFLYTALLTLLKLDKIHHPIGRRLDWKISVQNQSWNKGEDCKVRGNAVMATRNG